MIMYTTIYMSCDTKNIKSKNNVYICNKFTSRWVKKNGRVGYLLNLQSTKKYIKCKDIYPSTICNHLTGININIDGPTHNILKAMEKNKFKIGETILQNIDNEYHKVIYAGQTYAYDLYELDDKEHIKSILQRYAMDPQSFGYTVKTGINIDDINEQSCLILSGMHDQCLKNSICKFENKTCSLAPNLKLKIGDIVTLYTDNDTPIKNLILNIKTMALIKYNTDDTAIMVNMNYLMKDIKLDKLICNNIVTLVHGTNDLNLTEIITSNKLLAFKSVAGVIEAVSTYPILNCDIGHKLPFWAMWGENKIFLSPQLLIDFSNWRLGIKTDTSVKKILMPFSNTTLNNYFFEISTHRYHVWSDDNYDESFGDYMGELAFFNNIINIKSYILFVAIKFNKIDLISTIKSMGIKVITYNSSDFILTHDLFIK